MTSPPAHRNGHRVFMPALYASHRIGKAPPFAARVPGMRLKNRRKKTKTEVLMIP